MNRRCLASLLVTLCTTATAPLWAQEEQNPTSTDTSSLSTRQVLVTNFPELYRIAGEVTVKDPLPQSSLVAFRDITVPPVAPKDTTRLINAGTLTADGFTGVVLTLVGQLKGENARAGTVGAILVPDEEVIERAFEEQGQVLLMLEVSSPTGSGTPPYFASQQQRALVAFPRYRVLLYNTTDKAATVNVFAYLVN